MQAFEAVSRRFQDHFSSLDFPQEPKTLYEPAGYFLSMGGKRIRPVLCLMASELYGQIQEDAFHVATAIELFHNFSLIHDDIMDKAPLRRGMTTLHNRYGEPTALLTGDVMLVLSYDYLGRIRPAHLKGIFKEFSACARMVCEGQQLDMDFESQQEVRFEDYIRMIELKTSVLLAASLKMGAIVAEAHPDDQKNLYEFGKNLGIAFQIQDDYLDAFGDPEKFGKQVGGDIIANKKTFLLIRALDTASPAQRDELRLLLSGSVPDKVERVVGIFRNCGVDTWANDLKEKYMQVAGLHLTEVGVPEEKKLPLNNLMEFLFQRDH